MTVVGQVRPEPNADIATGPFEAPANFLVTSPYF